MPNCPEHLVVVLAVEGIASINQEESPVFLLFVLLPKELHYVNATLDTHRETGTQLVDAAQVHCFGACHGQHTFHHAMMDCVANANWAHSWALVKCNKTPCL